MFILLAIDLGSAEPQASAVKAPPRRTPSGAAVAPVRKAPGLDAEPAAEPAAPAPAPAPAPVAAARPEPKPEPKIITPQPRPTAAQPTPAPKAAPVASPKPVEQVAPVKFEAAPTLQLKFDTPTAVPAARKQVAPAKTGNIPARNFDAHKSSVTNTVDSIFQQLQSEFQKVIASISALISQHLPLISLTNHVHN